MRMLCLFALLALGGCDRDAPPAPSARQSARLDEAEDMLNDMGEATPANEEGPGAKAPDPSANRG